MSSFRILHITDWHINDPNSQNEKLRRLFYRDYINGLYNELESQGINEIDYLVCSGDFIDRGKVENFDLVKEITDYLIQKFSIKKQQLITTIGNHDIKIDAHRKGDKGRYLEYSKNYGPERPIVNEDLYKIFKVDDNIFCLLLDSVFDEQNEINNDSSSIKIVRPSNITGSTVDKIVTEVGSNIPMNSLLLIVSHFPMIINNRMEMIIEEEGWVEKHLWKSGRNIIKRLLTNRKNASILCLYGDGHVDNFWSFSDKHHFFMTGGFGGDYLGNTYIDASSGKTKAFKKTNDAKIIDYNNLDKPPVIYTLSYSPEGMVYNSQTGDWKTYSGAVSIENLKDVEELYQKKSSHELKTAPVSKIQLISEYIEREIIDYIKSNDLYFFARTATSDNESSLGWVSISTLFQNQTLFAASIEKTNEWLTKNTDNSCSNECLLIGLGFWGSIFASQINVRRNNTCTCISSKRIKKNETHLESIGYVVQQLQQQSSTTKEIIIFTDVISTGTSISTLKESIAEKMDISKVKFYGVCVIADKNQLPNTKVNDFIKIGSLCTNIPIPVIENTRLPDETIFPTSYDFR